MSVSTAYLVLCQNMKPGDENLQQQASPPLIVEIHITSDDYSKRFTIGRSVNQNLQISRTRDGKEVISRRHAEVYKPSLFFSKTHTFTLPYLVPV